MELRKNEICERQIYEVLHSQKGHPLDVCVELIRIMSVAEHPYDLLRTVLEYSSPVGDLDNKNPTVTSLEAIERFVRWNFRYIVHYTRLLARKNISQDDFYQNLYKDLFTPGNGLIPDSEISKAMTLEILANHVRCVPYYQLSEEKNFSFEEFEESVNRIEEVLQIANHYLQRDFTTKTEAGIQFYRLMESIPEERDRIVFLSLLLGMVRSDAASDND